MATNGYSLPADGKTVCSFTGNNVPGSVSLEANFYVVNVSLCDANSPGGLTITDPAGNATTFSEHGSYRYAATAQPYGSYTISAVSNVDVVSFIRPKTPGAA